MSVVTITGDGRYAVNNKHKNSISAVYISGIPGTSELNFSYKSPSGGFEDFTESAAVVGEQLKIMHGRGVEVFIEVTNSDVSTAMELLCTGID